MNFSSVRNEDGYSLFSLGKRSAESLDELTFKGNSDLKQFYPKSDKTISTNSELPRKDYKKSKTSDDKKKKNAKKRRQRNDQSAPYTFEKVIATPTQFYNKFEELLKYNSNMNQSLSTDIDSLERNLKKLQYLNKGKSNKDLSSELLNTMCPKKKVKLQEEGITNDNFARKMTE